MEEFYVFDIILLVFIVRFEYLKSLYGKNRV